MNIEKYGPFVAWAVATAMGLMLLADDARAADSWTKKNTAMEAAFVGLVVADYFQTIDIKNHDDIREVNPVARVIIGHNPEPLQTAGYMAASVGIHWAISRTLPKGWREAWQAGTVVVQAGVVGSNYHLGLGVQF